MGLEVTPRIPNWEDREAKAALGLKVKPTWTRDEPPALLHCGWPCAIHLGGVGI